MTKALSLYLDALRFAAAITVFLSHYGTGRISGALFWRLAYYGRAAVLVFFVISGFVISWVADTKEDNLEDYALSRVSRLYSVILPAFILTAVLDHFGAEINQRLYAAEWGHTTNHPLFDYVVSAVFLGESWAMTALPGFNVPFWSLNYEAWYYGLFGIVRFLRGRFRIGAFSVGALVAGPKILLMFPIWLMGVAAWRIGRWVPHWVGRPLVGVSLAGLVGFEALGGQGLFSQSKSIWLPPEWSMYDYIISALVALLIVGLANSELPMPSARSERIVRGLAGTTFGLYLVHYPLLNFFATIIPGPPDGAIHRVVVFGLTLSLGLGLAWLIEPRKGTLKRALRSMLPCRRATWHSHNQALPKKTETQ